MHLWVDSVRVLQPIVVRIEKQGHQFLPHKINVPFYSSSTNRIGCPYGVGYLSLAALPTPPAHQAKHQEAVDPRKKGGKGTRAGRRKRGGPAGGMESVPELSISGDAGRRAAPGRRPAGPARKRSVGGSIGAVEFCRSDGQCALHACRVRSSGLVGGDSGVCCKWQFCPFIDLRSFISSLYPIL